MSTSTVSPLPPGAAAPGHELPERRFTLTRADLVRYAGASGDFNPIHYDERAAEALGLPGVIAHGMLTMGLAATALNGWFGPSAHVAEYETRFARPVVVPPGEGVELVVSGRVDAVLEDSRIRVALTAVCGGERVLARARAVVVTDR
ncbi:MULTISPECIES: MaoC/PaaZ C-terminal domain-containing protein [unclassified Nocardiopsis]|uniref:MaoC/PaaZ C-terminal domain-containing protein n=1 Tax=unclassified Nocardiopsis TaxID=2649073 RepID=UPI00135C11D9|nr:MULTISPECIES: MaoC/PaaZ C-terminal domain-containing protein [unclassified Nocardiopsis]